MDIQRITILARRVFAQILHDRRTLALIFFVPILVLALAGVLIKSNPEDIALGVVNQDQGVPGVGLSLAALVVPMERVELEKPEKKPVPPKKRQPRKTSTKRKTTTRRKTTPRRKR